MADKDRIHRWITQADLERMLADAYRKGAEAMREAAADLVSHNATGWASVGDIEAAIRALPIPEDRP
jgi:hypothetical protein